MMGYRFATLIAVATLTATLVHTNPCYAQTQTSESDPTELEKVRQELEQVTDELEQIRREVAQGQQAPLSVEHGERVAYGKAIRIQLGEHVEEVVVFGDHIEVAGVVTGDATTFGGDIIITETGEVGGDAVSFGGQIHIAEGGTLQGDRVALGVPGMPISTHAETAQAAGSVSALVNASTLFDTLYRRLVLFLAFAGAGVLVVGVFPQRVGKIATNVELHPIRSIVVGTLATGFLSLFSLLFGIVTLGLGLPVSIVVWVLLGLAWLLGFVGLCQAIGDRLPVNNKPQARWLTFLVGVFLVTCVSGLPLVGWLVIGAGSLLGVGAALSTGLGGR